MADTVHSKVSKIRPTCSRIYAALKNLTLSQSNRIVWSIVTIEHRGHSLLARLFILLIATVLAFADQASGQTFVREELHVPMMAADPDGLEAVLVRLNQPGRFPLALINHGSPRSASVRPCEQETLV